MTRVLVLSPEGADEHLAALPFFLELRATQADSRITLACPSSVRMFHFKGLVDEVLAIPAAPGPDASLWEVFLAAHELGARLGAGGPWDSCISLSGRPLLTWTAWRAGIREIRRSAPGDPLVVGGAGFWSLPPENPLDEPMVGRYASVDWKQVWGDIRQAAVPAGPYWVLAPGAVSETRQWPVERHMELARLIHARTGLPGFVLGLPRDAPIAVRICADPETGLQDLTARHDLTQLTELLSGSEFVVSNDSEVATLALLCGAQTHVIWGGRDQSVYHPRGPGRLQLILEPVNCWPCDAVHCAVSGEQKLQCLRRIDPGKVAEAVLAVHAKYKDTRRPGHPEGRHG